MTRSRDVVRTAKKRAFATLLKRIAKSVQSGKPISIAVRREKIKIPSTAKMSIEHERSGKNEEIELQFTWKREAPKKTRRTSARR